MTQLPRFMEVKKEELAAAVAVLKSLLANPDDFVDLKDFEDAKALLADRLDALEAALADLNSTISGMDGNVTTHYHLEDRDLGVSSGQLPLNNNSPEILAHLGDSLNPHHITYLILGNDLGGLTFTNAGSAINPTDLPNLQQIQMLIMQSIATMDLSAYEPVIAVKNTAFNKNFGNEAGTVAEGNHFHAGVYQPYDENISSHLGSEANPHNVTTGQIGAEPAFAKNTAFNKNFGAEAGTVAEGNHTHEGLATEDHNHDTLYEPKNDNIQLHIADVTNNPHQISAAQIGAEPAFAKQTAFNKDFGSDADTVAEGNHNHDGTYAPVGDYVVNSNLTTTLEGYEPAFTKETGFNLPLGDTAGTVAEGNHTHADLATDDHNHDALYEPKNDNIQLHIADVTNNPHQVTATQTGAEPAFAKNTAFNKNFGSQADTVAEGNHNHNGVYAPVGDYVVNSSLTTTLEGYEPAFTKETGFNLPLGTIADTVAEGNHNHDGTYVPMTGGLIPLEYIPDTILGQVEYQGTWNAALNTPVLPDPTTVKGHYYVVNTDGVYSTIAFEKGDWVISDGTKWDIVKNTDAVRTVFGRLGDIDADANDYAAFYEPIFAKNTAFNKNFGTEAGTVAEGNHTHEGIALDDHNHDTVYEPKNDNIQLHISDVTNNPHQVTAAQTGAEPAFTKETGFNLPLGTIAGTVAEGNHVHADLASSDHNHDGTYEPVITIKNTAFNKPFGTEADTVAEGDHFHGFELLEQKTAFNKDFGSDANTVAEGNHNHDGIYAPIGDYVVNSNLTTTLEGYEPAFTKETGFNLPLGTEANTVAEGNHTHADLATDDHNHDGTYEPVITVKNTAFNLSLGTTVGTVAEGNHIHAEYAQGTNIQLVPEFTNCVFSPLAAANTLGTMKTGHDLVGNMNFYQWQVSEVTEQVYNIVTFIDKPYGLSEWTAVDFALKTEGAAGVTMELYDTQGTLCYSSGALNSEATWLVSNATLNLAAINAGNWTGTQFKVVFKVAANNGSAYLGHVNLGFARA